jgi:hypothetical protein
MTTPNPGCARPPRGCKKTWERPGVFLSVFHGAARHPRSMKGQANAEQASPGADAHGRSEAAGPPPSGGFGRFTRSETGQTGGVFHFRSKM